MPSSHGAVRLSGLLPLCGIGVCLQEDVMPHLRRLSKVFQEENVNLVGLKVEGSFQYFIFDTVDHTLLVPIRYLLLRLHLLRLFVISSL